MIREKCKWIWILIGCMIFLTTVDDIKICYGDTLILAKTENTRITGKALEMKNGVLSFLCDDGTVANIKWKDIKSINIEDKIFITIDTKETILGSISASNDKMVITSPTLGKINSTISKVMSIERKRKELEHVFTVSPLEMASVRAKGTEQAPKPKAEGTQVSADSEEKSESKLEPKPDSKSENRPQTIGEKSSERIPEEMFLREEKVLIPKGRGEAEVNLTYVNQDRSAPLLGVDNVRSLIPSITARYGVTNKLLGFVTVPYVFNWRELQDAFAESTKNVQSSGLGDIYFGLNYQLFNEGATWPSLMLSLTANSPTGKPANVMSENQEKLGTGHWGISPGLSLVKTVDPVTLFGSLYYTHVFPAMISRQVQDAQTQNTTDETTGTEGTSTATRTERVEEKLGDSVNFLLGVGFALNEKVTLSFRSTGSFIFRDKIDNKEIANLRTPFYFYATLDYMLMKYGYIEPSVGFGLTKDTSDVILSMSYVYRFY